MTWDLVCVSWETDIPEVEKASGYLEMEIWRLKRMRPEIYFTSYALYFIEDLLYAPEDSGSGIYADCRSGISLACGAESSD